MLVLSLTVAIIRSAVATHIMATAFKETALISAKIILHADDNQGGFAGHQLILKRAHIYPPQIIFKTAWRLSTSTAFSPFSSAVGTSAGSSTFSL
jgi:hypothetical protein